MIVRQPLVSPTSFSAFDIRVNVDGGGESGQAARCVTASRAR